MISYDLTSRWQRLWFWKNSQFIELLVQFKWNECETWDEFSADTLFYLRMEFTNDFLMFLSLIFAHLLLQAKPSHSSAPNLVRVTICSPINLYTNNIYRFEKRNPIVDLHQICASWCLFAVERRSYQSIVKSLSIIIYEGLEKQIGFVKENATLQIKWVRRGITTHNNN